VCDSVYFWWLVRNASFLGARQSGMNSLLGLDLYFNNYKVDCRSPIRGVRRKGQFPTSNQTTCRRIFHQVRSDITGRSAVEERFSSCEPVVTTVGQRDFTGVAPKRVGGKEKTEERERRVRKTTVFWQARARECPGNTSVQDGFETWARGQVSKSTWIESPCEADKAPVRA